MCAAWTEASWRDSNSDWVTMSPLTRAMMRSTISAREEAERARVEAARRAARLGRTQARDGFMVHLGPGHQVPDELADALVRLPAQELGPRRLPALRGAGLPRGDALLHPQDVVAERALDHVARLPRGQREGRLLQLRGQLSTREPPHHPARARLRRARAG